MLSYQFLNEKFLNDQGVIDWGYTEEHLAHSYHYFQNWVENGNAGSLEYLKGQKALTRESIKNYFPHFQSALVFLFPYYQTKKDLEQVDSKLKIASYVHGFYGEDYHLYLRQRLGEIKNKILNEVLDCEILFTLDTQPVLERDLAYRAGLGWFGKNSMLISREHGSYFIIGSLLLSRKLHLGPASMGVDHCGQCRACIEACPTLAITPERTIIAQKCISTYTIEVFKDEKPPEGYQNSHGEIFGCDICQEVCPWNVKKLKTLVSRKISNPLIDFFYSQKVEDIIASLESMSKRAFRKFFANTPLERTGRDGVLKNIKRYLK